MDMIRVNSSAILAEGYEPGTRRMKITFEQGDTYNFCNVPQSVYQGLMNARSKGAYYNSHIRDRYSC